MAQIFAFGRVENDLVPKKSQKDSTYVCFGFTEQTGKGQFQYYQVWAWDDEVSRLARLGVKKDSRLWITGTQQLVDCTAGHGKERTKILKIYLSNFGFLPGRIPHVAVSPRNSTFVIYISIETPFSIPLYRFLS